MKIRDPWGWSWSSSKEDMSCCILQWWSCISLNVLLTLQPRSKNRIAGLCNALQACIKSHPHLSWRGRYSSIRNQIEDYLVSVRWKNAAMEILKNFILKKKHWCGHKIALWLGRWRCFMLFVKVKGLNSTEGKRTNRPICSLFLVTTLAPWNKSAQRCFIDKRIRILLCHDYLAVSLRQCWPRVHSLARSHVRTLTLLFLALSCWPRNLARKGGLATSLWTKCPRSKWFSIFYNC